MKMNAWYRHWLAQVAASVNLTYEEFTRPWLPSYAEQAWIDHFRTPLLNQPLLLAPPEQRP